MSVLCPSQRYYTQQGRPAVSLLQRAQSILHIVADSSFAALAFLDAVTSYVTVVTRLRLDAALYVYPGPASVGPPSGSPPLQREPFTLPSTPSGTTRIRLANHNDPLLVWPPAAHRGNLFPNRHLVSHRLAARADSMAPHPRSPSHLCASSVAGDPSEPVAPADADIFSSALGGRNHL